MAPLPEDDCRKLGDQQAWTSEQRHALTRHVDERARDAIETYTTLPEDADPFEHIEAGELGDVATEVLEEIDSIPR